MKKGLEEKKGAELEGGEKRKGEVAEQSSSRALLCPQEQNC